MDGPEAYGIGQDAARIAGGAAVAAGGYSYFTKARGWKLVLGIATSFGGGIMFYRAGASAVAWVFAEPMPDLAAGVAGTMTLGVIYALRKAAEKINLDAWTGKRA
jgi:hypothetical protein